MKFSDISLTSEKNEYFAWKRSVLLKPADISPLAAYLTLKDMLGAPNSDDFDDSKSQWCYRLSVPGALIEVYDWKLESWSIEVYDEHGDEEKAYEIGQQFIELIAKNSPHHGKKIECAVREATIHVIQNPFHLYYDSSTQLLEMANTETPYASDDLYRAAFFMFVSSFEGLMNLIYELYLKPDLRDERIFERLAREQIDIKIRLAPVYCECFSSRTINHEEETFRKFHSVINLRNDFIHANLTKPMKRALITQDDYAFVVEPEMEGKYGLPKSISGLTTDNLKFVKDAINDMVDLLLDNMKPRYRREFRNAIEHEFIQTSIVDGETIVDWAY